jgi:hypothetical protein
MPVVHTSVEFRLYSLQHRATRRLAGTTGAAGLQAKRTEVTEAGGPSILSKVVVVSLVQGVEHNGCRVPGVWGCCMGGDVFLQKALEEMALLSSDFLLGGRVITRQLCHCARTARRGSRLSTLI